jgi:alkanesulfonate monooxygenase SsuD/methylene tetrahydromethanopterin reductase-like flavin-dependent oxidoreductase (luciferase family)
MGISRERRVSRFRESLSLMRKLWTEKSVTHHGRFYNMDNVTVEPKPVQKPGIPILIGGSADRVL